MAQTQVPQLEVISGRPPALTLTLEVTDPDVLAELRRQPDEAARAALALHALRIGVLALRAAAEEIEASLRAVEKRLNDLEDIKTLAATVTSNGQKIPEKAGRLLEELTAHFALLDRQVLALQTEEGPAAERGRQPRDTT
jgi:hypothetical protein